MGSYIPPSLHGSFSATCFKLCIFKEGEGRRNKLNFISLLFRSEIKADRHEKKIKHSSNTIHCYCSLRSSSQMSIKNSIDTFLVKYINR